MTATTKADAGFVCFSTSWKNEHLPPVSSQVKKSAPRARGDGPDAAAMSLHVRCCSPHTRGWTRLPQHLKRALLLLPAHAGMDPTSRRAVTGWASAPRARGDGPAKVETWRAYILCSPRTRGWPRLPVLDRARGPLLPARAGMISKRGSSGSSKHGCPRAGGDGPQYPSTGVAGAAGMRLPPGGQRSSSSSKRRMAGGSVSVGGTFMVLRAKDMMSLNTGPAASPP